MHFGYLLLNKKVKFEWSKATSLVPTSWIFGTSVDKLQMSLTELLQIDIKSLKRSEDKQKKRIALVEFVKKQLIKFYQEAIDNNTNSINLPPLPFLLENENENDEIRNKRKRDKSDSHKNGNDYHYYSLAEEGPLSKRRKANPTKNISQSTTNISVSLPKNHRKMPSPTNTKIINNNNVENSINFGSQQITETINTKYNQCINNNKRSRPKTIIQNRPNGPNGPNRTTHRKSIYSLEGASNTNSNNNNKSNINTNTNTATIKNTNSNNSSNNNNDSAAGTGTHLNNIDFSNKTNRNYYNNTYPCTTNNLPHHHNVNNSVIANHSQVRNIINNMNHIKGSAPTSVSISISNDAGAELQRLRKENAELKRENAELKRQLKECSNGNNTNPDLGMSVKYKLYRSACKTTYVH